MNATQKIPDNTPIIVGAGQCVEFSDQAIASGLSSPMDLAAAASAKALEDAGVNADVVDTIATIRLFSDTVKTWASPFGASNNPPESIARRVQANPERRIYSMAGGNEPLRVMMELLQSIARGECRVALLSGAEAIANQRYALKNNIELDWHEEYEVPLDNREYLKRFASAEEIGSGMTMPVHYYALIENAQAASMGHTQVEHKAHMSAMFAPFSAIAAANAYSQFPTAYAPSELTQQDAANYAISLPYSKRLIAQDAVNQSAALVLTSAGEARKLGIDPSRWIVVDAYAQGEDQMLTQRIDPGHSEAMSGVISSVLQQSGGNAADFDFIDIYSCFPCAVQAACDVLELPSDGSIPLTVTGGLPYFGGPGNNYSLHALAEMAWRLRGTGCRALVTANGGQLSKHAAVALRTAASCMKVIDWGAADLITIATESIHAVPYAEEPGSGIVLTYTVIARRDKDDIGLVLAENDNGERFLASTTVASLTASMSSQSPIGKRVRVVAGDERKLFEFVEE